ncbi:hypothetical protein [Companilactobacillus sp.]|jgi:hypothetical protein|uniref:hypothetical protein n=1 Tax=Companilactobacillus sp. TaxID=2767905 RepID=UPI0025BCD933|nr:hypothetical protein [Companilactobacillus sp.]MCH4009219.1 hypothetical protein [Companilactobacillus sp.]MCH4050602.1 hypothetical protein [Companilactobacillus sp.]MCH4077161.1 hypothetical protein [Companilactobacillus sp.]MCH4125737.1 hypothetical protein [Companilactobacillus sp.]MCI1311446.1 hypothetical protein [Companilactobacillus sp.]
MNKHIKVTHESKVRLMAIAGLTLSAGMIFSEISVCNVNAATIDSTQQESFNINSIENVKQLIDINDTHQPSLDVISIFKDLNIDYFTPGTAIEIFIDVNNQLENGPLSQIKGSIFDKGDTRFKPIRMQIFDDQLEQLQNGETIAVHGQPQSVVNTDGSVANYISSGHLGLRYDFGSSHRRLTLVDKSTSKKVLYAQYELQSVDGTPSFATPVGLKTTDSVHILKDGKTVVTVPQVEGYISNKKTVEVSLNENGTLAYDKNIIYSPIVDNIGTHEPEHPSVSTNPVKPVHHHHFVSIKHKLHRAHDAIKNVISHIPHFHF